MAREKFDPEDEFLKSNRKVGRDQIDTHLRSKNLKFGSEIVTSRDRGWKTARLKRANMPKGWEKTWQLPLYLKNGTSFFFYQEPVTGSVLPPHDHKAAQFRIILSGTVTFNRKKLGPGDWMYIPAHAKYTMKATSNAGPVIVYCY